MVIGITGGIGSGKSTVARLFELLGCKVFNSDLAAKHIYFEESIRPQIIQLLGKEAYLDAHHLNKTHINQFIFSNTELLQKLNAIIHPAVKKQFENFVLVNKAHIVIKETALLFEAHLEKGCDSVLVVAADDELRINRVMKRDGLSKEEVLKKMQSQLAQSDKIKKANKVIYNDEHTLLIPQVVQLYEEFSGSKKLGYA